jgi:uncharacterized damage-inducible protein DinB
MYSNVEDFLEDWHDEMQNTVKVFSCITPEAKSVKVHEHIRTLDRLAWHIVQTISEMGTRAGLFTEDSLDEQSIPATFEEIIGKYRNFSQQFFNAVKASWTNDYLQDYVNMYGQVWKKGKVLSVVIAHEAHHRSQMTIIMRLLGVPVPGIYGPSKEEWVAMGMPPME